MRTFKNWLITALLKKDKLVAVPEKWQVDYVKTASNNVKNTQAIVSLIKEYNGLLLDYFKKCSVKELKETITDTNIKGITSKEQLVQIAYEESKMTYERN